MTEKKTQMKDEIPRKRRKYKGRGKKEGKKKKSGTKEYVGHRNKIMKMTRSFINDKQNCNIPSKSHHLWHSLQRNTTIKKRYNKSKTQIAI